jgi:hypothetical protein
VSRLVLGLVVLCVVALFALCVCAANATDDEPRLLGKFETLERLARYEPSWVLPHTLVRIDQGCDAACAALAANTALDGRALVLKPNNGSFASRAVLRTTSNTERKAALAIFTAAVGHVRGAEVLGQEWADGMEVRLFASARPRSSEGQPRTWEFHDAVAQRDGSAAPVPFALAHRIAVALDVSFPRATSLALDVMTPSWRHFQDGDFVVLEVNGAFGIPFGHARSDELRTPLWRDISGWVLDRAWRGARNVLHGHVNPVQRAMRELRASASSSSSAWDAVDRAAEAAGWTQDVMGRVWCCNTPSI